jgi:hypothetical protein
MQCNVVDEEREGKGKTRTCTCSAANATTTRYCTRASWSLAEAPEQFHEEEKKTEVAVSMEERRASP